MNEIITSTSNGKIKRYAKLLNKKYRDKENLFIVEGFHLVEEAKKANVIYEVLTSDLSYENATYVSEEVIKKLSSTISPQPIVAVCQKIDGAKLLNRTLALNNVQDPGNLGTLIRSALAFGFDSILVQGVDIYNPKVIRSSQGAIFQIPIVQCESVLDHMQDYETIGAILDKEALIYNEVKPSDKFMLILGNEGNGIEKEVIDKLDKKVYIPINFESLNVASAGAILMNEYKKVH